MTSFANKLYLSLICPQSILPEGLRLTQVCSCKLQSGFFMPLCQKWGSPWSPAIALHPIHMTTYGSSWHCCTLSLQDSLNLCGSWLRLFIHHLNYPASHCLINFSPPSTFREICHSSMGYKLLDYIAHSWQRNFKISGDWLVTLRLLIFFHNFAS